MLKIGIDEAGRGPWAGPVFVGIVILNAEQEKLLLEAGVTDSKKLTEKKREELFPLILKNSVYNKVKYLSAQDLDQIGIYKATIFLIERLVEEIKNEELRIKHEDIKILIDGDFPQLELRNGSGEVVAHECIVKGDEKEASISAASILAKVRRDHYMLKLHEKFPQYSFDKHKGYGTKLHMEMIEKFGICEEHRTSFKPIGNILRKGINNI